MPSKRKPKEIDPALVEKYQKIVDHINELYINEFFKDRDSTSLNSENSCIDEELLKLNVIDDNDFEIISAMRYDPELGAPLQKDDELLNFESLIDFSKVFYNFNEPSVENDFNSNLFFLFDEHFHRLNFTLSYFKFDYQINRLEFLTNLNNTINQLDRSKPYKLRIIANRDKDVKIEAFLVTERFNLFDGLTVSSIDDYLNGGSILWSLHIDKEPTLISPFTSFKTTNRKHYTEARLRSLPLSLPIPGEEHEVLLYNSGNYVTEGSISNLAFKLFDKDSNQYKWFTPSLSSGCLCGVVRYMLLSKGLIKEKTISLKDIKVGDEVLIMNGVIGLVKGKIVD